jgi:hypothetical protein
LANKILKDQEFSEDFSLNRKLPPRNGALAWIAAANLAALLSQRLPLHRRLG